MTVSKASRQWMVRRAGTGKYANRHSVLGPYLEEQIKKLLQEGLLDTDDEIAPANGYWFALHDTTELKRFFDFDPSVLKSLMRQDDEATQPDLHLSAAESLESSDFDPDTTGIIRLPPEGRAMQSTPGGTVPPALVSRFARLTEKDAVPFEDQAMSAATASPRSPVRVERGRLWSVLLVLFFGLAAVGVLWVLKTLRAE